MKSSQPENKIYVAMIGGAPMASLDALLISLDRFINGLSSDSGRESYETAVRSVLPDIKAVHAFVDAVYAKKDPKFTITMKNRVLVVELNQARNEFFDCIQDQDIREVLTHVTAVGSMPVQKAPGFKTRDYTVFPVKYINGRFVKCA